MNLLCTTLGTQRFPDLKVNFHYQRHPIAQDLIIPVVLTSFPINN